MKFDILEEFQGYVKANVKSEATARKYYGAVKKLFEGIQFNNLQEIEREQLEQRLSMITGKDNFSAAKNGLKLLKEFDPSLNIPDESFFRDTSAHKKNHRKNSKRVIYVSMIKRTVNQISDKKLMLAYRLALVSGLRVSELEALTAKDVNLKDGKITINVLHGKGNKQRTVKCMEDPYVYKQLSEFIGCIKDDVKLFYAEETMRKKADELGMECHDMRRIYARDHKKKLKNDGCTNYQANKVVQKNLGHARYKTTKRYLYGKQFVD